MDRHGFTLIELAVVLALIGIVLALVLPRLPSVAGENLAASARTLGATLRYLQDRATTGTRLYALKIEPGTDHLSVAEVSSASGDREPDDPLLRKRPLREGIQIADVIIPRLGKVTEEQVRLEVGAAGLRDFVIIHLRSPEGGFWTVMAFPGGGKVGVYRDYLEEAP